MSLDVVQQALTQPLLMCRIVVLALITLLASACGSDKLEALADNATIVAFGDSLTKGKGTTENLSYPAVLQQLTGRTVLNYGVSGETTATGRERLPEILDETQPQLMLLMHGGNDILRNLGPAQAKSNLQAMIDEANSRSIVVVLIGIPERRIFSSVAPLYRELAEQNNLVLEDGIISSLLKKPDMKSDTVHFNERGYRAVAEKVHELLKDNGAL